MTAAEVWIKIRTSLDSKAIDEAKKKTEELGRSSEKVAETTQTKTVGSFEKLRESIKKVHSVTEVFHKLMTGVGIGSMLMAVIGIAVRLKAKFDEIAAAAREIKLEKITKENEDAVKRIAAEYDALLKSVEAVNTAITRQRELEALRTKNKRDLEDVQGDIAQQDELDKLDRKDPLYKEKSAEVRARHKSLATDRQSGREQEDLQIQMQGEGDKIRDLRQKEAAARMLSGDLMSEYNRQRKQIEDLNQPVTIKQKGGYHSGGAGIGNYSPDTEVRDDAATKQNQEKAKELATKLPDLEKKARDAIALADDLGNLIVLRANIASTISTARTVSDKKAGMSTRLSASERADVYDATDAAQKKLSDDAERKRLESEKEAINRQYRDADEKFGIDKILLTDSRDRAKREEDSWRGVRESYHKKGNEKAEKGAATKVIEAEAASEAIDKRIKEATEAHIRSLKNRDRRLEVVEESMKRINI